MKTFYVLCEKEKKEEYMRVIREFIGEKKYENMKTLTNVSPNYIGLELLVFETTKDRFRNIKKALGLSKCYA